MKVVCVVYVQETEKKEWIRCIGIKDQGDGGIDQAFTVDTLRPVDSVWDLRIAVEEGCFTLSAPTLPHHPVYRR